MTDRQDIEARLKEIKPEVIGDLGESVWIDHRDVVIFRDDFEWLITNLRASLAREKKMRWALEQYRSSEIDLGPLIARETLKQIDEMDEPIMMIEEERK